MIAATVGPEMFKQNYANVFKGDTRWNQIASPDGESFALGRRFHLHQEPALLRRHDDGRSARIDDVHGARVLGLFGDSITTDHISPGRQHQEGLAGGPLPAGARRAAGRLQQLRLAPRQR